MEQKNKQKGIKPINLGGIELPTNEGYCAMWVDENGNSHMINNSWSKTKARAQRFADEYQFIHQVETYVTECMY